MAIAAELSGLPGCQGQGNRRWHTRWKRLSIKLVAKPLCNMRHGLCGDLGFSPHDRHENIRRIGEVAKLFMDAGVIVLTAFISPYCADRARVRGMVEQGDFIEIYCDASMAICESRDVKGMYKKARAGQIPQFTGISSPYEVPATPELAVRTGTESLEVCARQVIDELMRRGFVWPVEVAQDSENK